MSTEEWVLLLLALYLFTRPAVKGDVDIGDAAIGENEIGRLGQQ